MSYGPELLNARNNGHRSEERAMLNELLERMWNAGADEFNRWKELSLDEKLEFATKVERERWTQQKSDKTETLRDYERFRA